MYSRMAPCKTSFTLVEKPCLKACEHVWDHPSIDGRRQGLKKYCDAALANGGSVDVEYAQKYDYGRFYTVDTSMCSASPMPSSARTVLFGATERDIDIVACHQSILLMLLEKHYPDDAESYRLLKQYVESRDDLLKQFNVPKGVAKQLFNIIVYGGSFNTWVKDQEIDLDTLKYPKVFVMNFEQEVRSITPMILAVDRFKPITQSFQKYKLNKAKEKYQSKFDVEKFHLAGGKLLSAILQDKETCIIRHAMKYLQSNGVVVTAYCFDGFQVTKNSWDSAHLDALNKLQRENGGGRVQFIEKPFKEPLDMSLCLTREDKKEFAKQLFQSVERSDTEHKTKKKKKEPKNKTRKNKKDKKKKEEDGQFLLPLEDISKGAKCVALAIAPELKKELVHCEEWYAFNAETNLWKQVKKPSYLIVSMIHKFLDKSIRIKNKESGNTEDAEVKKKISQDVESYCKFYRGCDSPSYLSNMRDHLSIILNDDDFVNTLDANVGYLAFANGMVNLKTMEFREGLRQDDYLTKTIPFDYEVPPTEDVAFVRGVIHKICNVND